MGAGIMIDGYAAILRLAEESKDKKSVLIGKNEHGKPVMEKVLSTEAVLARAVIDLIKNAGES